jgi:hypothetical protein
MREKRMEKIANVKFAPLDRQQKRKKAFQCAKEGRQLKKISKMMNMLSMSKDVPLVLSKRQQRKKAHRCSKEANQLYKKMSKLSVSKTPPLEWDAVRKKKARHFSREVRQLHKVMSRLSV